MKTTLIDYRMPTPAQLQAIEFEARRMRAETFAAGFRALGRLLFRRRAPAAVRA